jgi:hypothetical protein
LDEALAARAEAGYARPTHDGRRKAQCSFPERKDNYTVAKLHKEWLARKPELVHALESAVEEAENEEN